MELLDQYCKLQKELHAYFGYVEDWAVMPIQDLTEYWWSLSGESPGSKIYFSTHKQNLLPLDEDAEDLYYDELFIQIKDSKCVYRGADYTMVSVDTHTDGNRFLSIFDNSKEITRLC